MYNANELELLIKVIKNIIVSEQGCKESLLIAKIVSIIEDRKIEKYINNITAIEKIHLINIYSKKFNMEDIENIMNILIDNKEITYITYTLPNMEYRTKSLIFPKGTEVKIHD